MLDTRTWSASVAALACAWMPMAAMAQEAPADLMAMDKGELKDEIARRYDEALARTETAAVVSEDSTAFVWASQAKAQCGIALGFLKSGTKDPVSIGKCDDAWRRMAAPPPPPPAPAQAPAPCLAQPNIVFFDWDSAVISPDAGTTLDTTVAEVLNCGAAGLRISGFADRSGPDSYNQRLSSQRAEAVRAYLAAHGVTSTMTTEAFGEANPRVPTADGVREIQNRRVEISVD